MTAKLYIETIEALVELDWEIALDREYEEFDEDVIDEIQASFEKENGVVLEGEALEEFRKTAYDFYDPNV